MVEAMEISETFCIADGGAEPNRPGRGCPVLSPGPSVRQEPKYSPVAGVPEARETLEPCWTPHRDPS